MLSGRHLEDLARFAAQTVLAAVDGHADPVLSSADPVFEQPGACFVSLHQGARLRGCIGTLAAWRPLLEDTAANARAAALRDPRFPPLTAAEVRHTEIEVSVLDTPAAMQFDSEDDFFRQLRPGVDGLVVTHGDRRATYLPAVWAQLPDPRKFVAELRRKAGIAPGVPLTALAVERYQTHISPALPLTA